MSSTIMSLTLFLIYCVFKYSYSDSHSLLIKLLPEGLARYADLLLAPAEGFKQGKTNAFYAIFGLFRKINVFSSNLSKS